MQDSEDVRARNILKDDPEWYKDAVIYEVSVRSFKDSNADGIGDFTGLTQKLDYLEDLGINTVWLLPFYPSPLKDDGYDISDYYGIHSDYGDLEDFKEFIDEAHSRGIRIITELVLNHTSNQHPWFQKSRSSEPGSKWRDFYVWSDSPDKYSDARIIFQDFESSNWEWDSKAQAYYWHRFYSHQPDLNYDSPQVREEMLGVIDFWLGLGVDGMRLDAVPYLYKREGTNCENLPETHKFLKELRDYVDRNFENKMLLAEANQWPEDAAAYFGEGDEVHMAYNFPLMPRMFMSIKMEDRFPIIDILEQTPKIPESCQWAIFLRNHDELTLEMVTDEERDYMYRVYTEEPQARINLGIRRRLAPLLDGDRRKIELLNILLFTLPGTPTIYYGDEIGMGDNYYLGDRDGVRTPMQWSPGRNAGFSNANPQRLHLPVVTDPEYHYESINVESEERNPSSLLWWMKKLIAMRRKHPVLGRGELHFLSPKNPKVLAFIRESEEETVLVVANLSRTPQAAELDLSNYEGFVPTEIFSGNKFPKIADSSYPMTLTPFDYYCFSLKKEESIKEVEQRGIPEIDGWGDWENLVTTRQVEKLEKVIPNYVKSSRWFGSKGRDIQNVDIMERIPIPGEDPIAFLTVAKVEYTEGLPELYQIPISFTMEDDMMENLEKEQPQSILAEIRTSEGRGILYDSVFNENFREEILSFLLKEDTLKGKKGKMIPIRGKEFEKLDLSDLDSEVMQGEQSNTSLFYEDEFFLKLFRKLDRGVNPDLEISRFLTEETDYTHLPEFIGALEYRGKGEKRITIGILNKFVENEGNTWTYATNMVERYFERVLSEVSEEEEFPETPKSLLKVDSEDIPPIIWKLAGGDFLELIRLLGRRTGELHLALSSDPKNADFAPEPFSLHYQRSIYQSIRTLTGRVFRSARRNLDKIPERIEEDAEEILSAEPIVLTEIREILNTKISAKKVRIHGDYHLGQVLYTGNDFVIFDFEGEPARSLSERRLKYPVLRDVAGMIRSFHYAANSVLLQNSSIRREDISKLEPWADLWYYYISGVFLDTYLDTVEDSSLLPKERGNLEILLDCYLLEKAIYELGYELDSRPDWVGIPIKGIKFHLGERLEDEPGKRS